jgi:hypothetical protein
MRRPTKEQSRHDELVRRVAGGYKSQGWKVAADGESYHKPRTIFGRRPDVIATKGAKTRIVEVETKSSMPTDASQRNAFKRFASLDNKRRFRTRIA